MNCISGVSLPDIYPLPPCHEASGVFVVSADGQQVPVTAFDETYDYCHFSFAGRVSVEVTVPQPVRGLRISPEMHAPAVGVEGCQVRFELTESRYLILKIHDCKALILAADPPETDIPVPDGISVMDMSQPPWNLDTTGMRRCTDSIQHAVDILHQKGGGTLVFPAGVYLTANLVIKSHVHLYLAGGAVLLGTAVPGELETHWHKTSLGMHGTNLIRTEGDSENIRIYGRGTIDGQGFRMRRDSAFLNTLLLPAGTKNFTLDGVILRDSGLWGLIITRSSGVRILNYKHFNSLKHYEDDCLDVCESSDVTVRHALAVSEDDTFSVKSWEADVDIGPAWPGKPVPVERVVFDDCVAWTCCAAYKIGMGVCQPQRHITFRNSTVYDCSRGLAVHHRFGLAPAEHIAFENMVIEQVSGHRDGPYWLQVFCEDAGRGAGPVRHVSFRQIRVNDTGTRPSVIEGHPLGHVDHVTFSGIQIRGVVAGNPEDMGVVTGPWASAVSVIHEEQMFTDI